MPYVFELYYPGQKNVEREARLITDAMTAGGRLGCRVPIGVDDFSVCLTFEFDDRANAELVADALRQRGENVAGVFECAQIATGADACQGAKNSPDDSTA